MLREALNFDAENEQLILANALRFSSSLDALCNLAEPKDFIAANHQNLAWSLFKCKEKGLTVEDDTVLIFSKKSRIKPPVKYSYLQKLKKAFPKKVKNITLHIKKLRVDALKKNLRDNEIPRLLTNLTDPTFEIEEVEQKLATLQQEVISIQSRADLEFKTLKQVVVDYEVVERKRMSGKGFYPTGFIWLDKYLTEGFAPRTGVVIAGRPGSGKSALVGNFMRRLGNRKVHSAIFALEMNNISMFDRILSMESGIPVEDLIKNRMHLPKSVNKQIERAKQKLAGNPYLFFDDRAGVNLKYIRNQIRLLKETYRLDYLVVFVDLFGEIEDITSKNITAEFEKTLPEARNIAKELNVCIALVAQIGRKMELGKDFWKYRPVLNSLKNSGKWEEFADLILLLFRAKYYDPELEDDILEINIGKQRMGKAGDTPHFLFDGATSKATPTDLAPYDKRGLGLRGLA